ncbi:calcium-binding protein [Longimycelium tulufanense]|uniref:Calcium-binding protein n=1 Tax=Longimycelium tulufanense TaxID=907463 RepID=A0A8J3C974_9PSEU|nr:EF-hand domain-containing protein [Longimycelium tulufanense]GGM32657.1 calcium-binding protein [Longimycelium tulufanense]
MLTRFQRKKLNLRFDRLDADGDGYIEEGDYVLAARRIAGAMGRKGSFEAQLAEGRLRLVWRSLRQLDSNDDERISREEFVTAVARDMDGIAAAVRSTAEAVFDLCDIDGDGRLNRDEFGKMMNGFLVPDEGVTEGFEHLDVDEDGWVTRGEFVQGAIDLYCSADPSAPGSWLLGAVEKVWQVSSERCGD